ncbi:MAG: methyl-accepting chemotaxis protein [Negativicutes bacterium]|nr:methyl-accepting chemotaxis protein [Negativicutes bacterium]
MNVGIGFSLKKKLIVGFILLAALPVILTSLVTSYLSNSAIVSMVYENNQKLAVSLADNFNAMIDAKIKVLKVTASSPEIQAMGIPEQLQVLWSLTKQYPEMQLIVIDAAGNQKVRTEGNLASSADRDYFKQVKNGASYAVSDVLVAKGTGKTSVIISVPIKDSLDNFRGALIGSIDVMYLSRIVEETKIGQTGYVALLDRQGRVIAHPDKKLSQEMTDLSFLAPVKEAISGKTGAMSYEYQGARKLAGYSHIPLAGWGIVAQQPYDEALAGANQVRLTGVVATLVAIIIAVIVAFWAAGVLTRPVRELVAAAGRIAEGDLTAKATVASRDELGRMAETFNTMADNLQRLIQGIINTAELVVASSQQLSATSAEAERAASQIAATMGEFAQGSHQQTEEMDKTLKVVDHLSEGSQAVAEKAKSASALAVEMAKAAETGGGAVRNAMDKMGEIKEVTAATAKVVGDLGEKSSQIGQILDVISGIAGQTNLLALNAAIEAARAGEQGRGFAVVAEEVRKLAEQSQQATGEIAQIVREIQHQTGEAIAAMDDGSRKVNEGVDVVETAGQALQNILAQIDQSVAMIGDINTASSRQLQGMQDMVSSAGHVAAIARQSSAGAQNTAAASQEMTASMEQIAQAAVALEKLAGELQTMVARFRI